MDRDQRASRMAMPSSTTAAYPVLVIVAFLLLIVLLVLTRYFVPDRALKDFPWLIVLALVPVLPWVLAWAQSLFRTLKVGPLEMTFKDVTTPVDDVALQVESIVSTIQGALGIEAKDVTKVPESPPIMITLADVIIEGVKELGARRTPVLPIDLGNGDKWLLPNLYFLAAMLESITRVDLIVFIQSVENNRPEEWFVGACSPESLRVRLGVAWPKFEEARRQTQQPGQSLETAFWSELRRLSGDALVEPQWVTGQLLTKLLGQDLSKNAIVATDVPADDAILTVLFSERRFVPVITATTLEGFIDQYEVALRVARSVLPGM